MRAGCGGLHGGLVRAREVFGDFFGAGDVSGGTCHGNAGDASGGFDTRIVFGGDAVARELLMARDERGGRGHLDPVGAGARGRGLEGGAMRGMQREGVGAADGGQVAREGYGELAERGLVGVNLILK